MNISYHRAICIVDFERDLAGHFCDLNVEWLERYFSLELIDRHVLGDLVNHIIELGGLIQFARDCERVIGSCALMPEHDASGTSNSPR
jgi:putative acetyltransferase